MHKKKLLCLALSTTIVLSGCTKKPSSDNNEQSNQNGQSGQSNQSGTSGGENEQTGQSEKSGTFKGEASGFGGTVTAYVTFNNGVITEVHLEGPDETIGKGSVVLEDMPELIIKANGVDVDSVTGATITSDAVREAVSKAMESTQEVSYTKEEISINYTPGTYTGSAFGHNFPTTVEVTLSDSAIESIVVMEDRSDVAMHNATFEAIPERIINAQSLNVDSVSGATESSNAIINAVADCVTQASSEKIVTALKSRTRDKVEAVNEEYTADVVVIGGGGSGLTTAYSLSDQGYSVVVLEAADIYGGMSNVCGGGSLSIGSEVQNATGYYENEEAKKSLMVDTFNRLMIGADYQAKGAFISAYTDALDEYVDWAMEAGIAYQTSNQTATRLDNRGYRFDVIIDKMTKKNVTLLSGTRGTELLTDKDGKIVGAKGINRTSGTTSVNASAVVLATGGFLSNEEMSKEFIPEYSDHVENWSGSTRYQGDGVQMAWSVGAAKGQVGIQPHDSMIPEVVHSVGIATHFPTSYSNAAYYPSLWVDSNGKRFVNEDIGNISAELHGAATLSVGNYYTILDQKLIDAIENEGTPIGGWMSTTANPSVGLSEQIDKVIELGHAYKADSIEELAKKMNVDPDTLKEQVSQYNSYIEKGEDSQFHKDSKYLIDSIGDGPFYALENVSRVLACYGGLVIDENMNVADKDGKAIQGLYAVGLDAGSFMGNIYTVTTTTAGFSICSGYMAGNSVGEYLKAIK